MKTPVEIYAEYKIPPFLQLHQLRVTAVAKTIAENFDTTLDVRNVTLAALFHDMGNILKSDLSIFPEAWEPEGVVYWEKVKADFARRYGPDEHHATIAIGHELHLPLQAMRYIDGVGFSKLELTRDSSSYEQKIVEYADCRVSPRGVVLLDERFAEAHARYVNKPGAIESDTERYSRVVDSAHQVEQQVFARAKLRPEDITEASVQGAIAQLRDFPIG